MQKTLARGTPARRALTWLLALIGFVVVGVQTVRLAQPGAFSLVDDFVAYWGAAYLNLHGINPYTPETLFPLEASLGGSFPVFPMLWNPPWTLALFLPFALFQYNLARLVWLFTQLAVALIASLLCWRYYGGSERHQWLSLVIPLTLFPTLRVMSIGQSGVLLLAGVVGFLILERRAYWMRAGAVLALATIKPLVLVPMWIALLLWAVANRRWRFFCGGAAAVFALSAIALLTNPQVFEHYAAMTELASPRGMAVATVGGFLRLLVGVDRFWVQFVPVVVGAIWVLNRWRKINRTWRWKDEMPLLVLVSAVVMPYGWDYDLVVLIVPVIAVFAALVSQSKNTRTWRVVVPYVAINLIAALLSLLHVGAFWFFWLAPALLVWYLWARGRQDHTEGVRGGSA